MAGIYLAVACVLVAAAASCAVAYCLERLSNLRRKLRIRIEGLRSDLFVCESEGVELRNKATEYVNSLSADAVRALYELNGLLSEVGKVLKQAEDVYASSHYERYSPMVERLSAIQRENGPLHNWRHRADQLLQVIRRGVSRSDALAKAIRGERRRPAIRHGW